MADLTLEQLDALERRAHMFASWNDQRDVVAAVAMARSVPELEAARDEQKRIADGQIRAASVLSQRVNAQTREIADLETALKYSSELRIKSAIQFEIQLEAQAREIAELKAAIEQGGEAMRASYTALAGQAQLLAEAERIDNAQVKQLSEYANQLAGQAQLLAEARKLIEDMLDEIEPESNTACVARAMLAKLPAEEKEPTK